MALNDKLWYGHFMEQILQRYSAPNQYDHAPQGTLCKVLVDQSRWEIYIQKSPDEEHPQWELLDPP